MALGGTPVNGISTAELVTCSKLCVLENKFGLRCCHWCFTKAGRGFES